jgi:phosphomannomutase
MISTFIQDETGAVTVDWVVLTSALVGLGIAVTLVVSGGVENVSNDVAQTLADTSVEFTFFGNAADAASAIFSSAESIFYGEEQSNGFISDFSDPNNYSDEQLQQVYQTSQAYNAQSGNAESVDQLGILETAASNRGRALDAGDGPTFTQASQTFAAANS